jgi:hypothetical protein
LARFPDVDALPLSTLGEGTDSLAGDIAADASILVMVKLSQGSNATVMKGIRRPGMISPDG